MFKLKQVNPGAPHKQDRVYQVDGLSPCLGANSGGGQMPYIEVRQATKNGSIAVKSGGVVDIAFPKSKTRRGRVIDDGETSPTIDTGANIGQVQIEGDEIRIRKLTPKECFRLQGFPDEYFNRAAEVCSDSQLYKQAGNSVTVNVIYEIAKRLPK